MDPLTLFSVLTTTWDVVKKTMPNRMAKDIREMDKTLESLKHEITVTRHDVEAMKHLLAPITLTVSALLQEAKKRDPNFCVPSQLQQSLLLGSQTFDIDLTGYWEMEADGVDKHISFQLIDDGDTVLFECIDPSISKGLRGALRKEGVRLSGKLFINESCRGKSFDLEFQFDFSISSNRKIEGKCLTGQEVMHGSVAFGPYVKTKRDNNKITLRRLAR